MCTPQSRSNNPTAYGRYKVKKQAVVKTHREYCKAIGAMVTLGGGIPPFGPSERFGAKSAVASLLPRVATLRRRRSIQYFTMYRSRAQSRDCRDNTRYSHEGHELF